MAYHGRFVLGASSQPSSSSPQAQPKGKDYGAGIRTLIRAQMSDIGHRQNPASPPPKLPKNFGGGESLEEKCCRESCAELVTAIGESDATQMHFSISVLSDRRSAGALRTVHLLERHLQSLERDFEQRGCRVSHNIKIAGNDFGKYVQGLKINAALS